LRIEQNWTVSLQNWQINKKTKVCEIFVGGSLVGNVNAIPCGVGTYSLSFSPCNGIRASVYTTGRSDYRILIANTDGGLTNLETSLVDNLSDGQEEDLFLVSEDGSFDLVQVEDKE
jgi:hypothetical protein